MKSMQKGIFSKCDHTTIWLTSVFFMKIQAFLCPLNYHVSI